MSDWKHKADGHIGETLEKKSDSGTTTIFLPIVRIYKFKKRFVNKLVGFERRKKLPTMTLDFINDQHLAEALEGRKIKLTIEVLKK